MCSVSISMVQRSWLLYCEVEGPIEVPDSVVSDKLRAFVLLAIGCLAWGFLESLVQSKEYKSCDIGMVTE